MERHTTRLQRILLSWDYFQLANKLAEGEGVVPELRRVPPTFTGIDHYKSVFEPLLLEECGAQIMRGVEEGELTVPHEAVAVSNEFKDGFMFVKMMMHEDVCARYSMNDLVLICKDSPDSDECNERLHLIGYVDEREGVQSLRIRTYVSEDLQSDGEAGHARVTAMRAALSIGKSCWYLLRLSNMATIFREWHALQDAHTTPFSDILTSAKPRCSKEDQHLEVPEAMQAAMQETYNQSQMAAVTCGLDGSPVNLVQGPPGTGKTKTILGLLSIIMHSVAKGQASATAPSKSGAEDLTPQERAELWHRASPWVIGVPNCRDRLDQQAEPGPCFGLGECAPPRWIGKDTGPKAHVLLCAPSNAALDEMVLRVVRGGLLNASGNVFTPSLVRVGVNIHHSVASMGLDVLVEQRMASNPHQATKAASRVERDRMRLTILDECNVVCATLSFAGSSLFSRMSRRFDVVVIDEAAQCTEPSILVPIIRGCRQVYLVGDPLQLPATVISARAKDQGYDTSLFKRLQVAGYPVAMLNTQYRMHADIAQFPSRRFYCNQLLNGDSVAEGTKRPWHAHPCLGPLAFFDVKGRESVPEGSASIVNEDEATMVLQLYLALRRTFPAACENGGVAVISPYKAQVKLIRSQFAAKLGDAAARAVDINTVDGFQGREKEVVLFSTVRSAPHGRIGFLADERRANVGLTRAKCSLLVVGNVQALARDDTWGNLAVSAKARNCMFETAKPYAECVEALLAGTSKALRPSATDLKRYKDLMSATFNAGAEDHVDDDDADLYSEDEAEVAAAAAPRKRAAAKAAEQPGKRTRRR